MDGEVRKEANKIFKKQGFEFRLSTKVTGAERRATPASPHRRAGRRRRGRDDRGDVVLVSIGRRPNTEGLGLEAAGLALNKRGQIEVDHDFRTGSPASGRSAT
jgi:dihydrolipoamide dehydrogenase